jgi:hypothetical protein
MRKRSRSPADADLNDKPKIQLTVQKTQHPFVKTTSECNVRAFPSSLMLLPMKSDVERAQCHSTGKQTSPSYVACLSASSSKTTETTSSTTAYFSPPVLEGWATASEFQITPAHKNSERVHSTQTNSCSMECDEIMNDALLHQIQQHVDLVSLHKSYNDKELLERLGRRFQPDSAEFDQFVQTQWNNEVTYQPFMHYFSYQHGVTEDMRTVLFDWMYEVGADLKLQTDTVMRACNVVDRYLSFCPSHTIEQQQCCSRTDMKQHTINAGTTIHSGCGGAPPALSKTCNNTNNVGDSKNNVARPTLCTDSEFNIGQHNFQLLGVTALYTMGKFDEVDAPKLDDFCSTTDGACTMRQMIIMERQILKVIDWKLVAPTVSSWMMIFIRLSVINCMPTLQSVDTTTPTSTLRVHDSACADDIVRMVSADLFKHALNCVHIFARDARSLHYYPSTIAASMLCILHPPGTTLHTQVLAATSYAYSDLRRCIEMLQCVWTQVPLICDYQRINVFETPESGICTYLSESISLHRKCVERYECLEKVEGYQICHDMLDISSPSFRPADDIAQLKEQYVHAPIHRPLAISYVVPL